MRVQAVALFGHPCTIRLELFCRVLGLLEGDGQAIAFCGQCHRAFLSRPGRDRPFLNGRERDDGVAAAKGDRTHARLDGAAVGTNKRVVDIGGLAEADATDGVYKRRSLCHGKEVHERVPDHVLAASANQCETRLVHGRQHAVRADHARHRWLELEDGAKPILTLSTRTKRRL